MIGNQKSAVRKRLPVFIVSSLAFRFPLPRGTNGGVSGCSVLIGDPSLAVPLTKGNRKGFEVEG